MMSTANSRDLKASLSKLSLSSQNSYSPPPPPRITSKKPSNVADSWEDESPSSGDDDDDDDVTISSGQQQVEQQQRGPSSSSTTTSSALPSAPPPTPISPVAHANKHDPAGHLFNTSPHAYSPAAAATAANNGASKRPEKTDAVAKRLIAGALGVRAPKKTEEQRAYDRALREKEVRRREEEKTTQRKAQEEAEKARKAVWDD